MRLKGSIINNYAGSAGVNQDRPRQTGMYGQSTTSLQKRLGNPETSSFIHLPQTCPLCLFYLHLFNCSNKNPGHPQFVSFGPLSSPPRHPPAPNPANPANSIYKLFPTCSSVSFSSDFTLVLGIIISHLDSGESLLIRLPISTHVLFVIHYPKGNKSNFSKM